MLRGCREGLPTANKLQGIDTSCWSGGGFRIVLRSLCEIEDLGVVWKPSHPGEAQGSSQHITGNVLYRSLLSGRNTNGIVDARTTSPPGEKQLDALLAQESLVLE